MRERRRRWASAAAILVGLLAALPVRAQPGGAFGDGEGPGALEFAAPRKGHGADFPHAAKGPPPGPFEFTDTGENAFCDGRPVASPLKIWLKGEYLLWQLKPDSTNIVLATTSLAPADPTLTGALGRSGTVPLLGPAELDYRQNDGGRITLGLALFDFIPPIEISGFWLTNSENFLSRTSSGAADALALARPVVTVSPAQEFAFTAGFPGGSAGSISVDGSQEMSNVEANIFMPLGASDVLQVDAFIGFRYQNLRESLNISNSLTSLTALGPVFFGGVQQPIGSTTSVLDSFTTDNRFVGGQLGLRALFVLNRLALLLDGKLAIGPTHQQLRVSGVSTLGNPQFVRGATSSLPGGILAQPSNSGAFSQDHFTIIPEIAVNLGFEVTPNLRLFAGFSAFSWSDVVRPGDQLSDVVDIRQAPTSPTFNANVRGLIPAQTFTREEFWGYGLNFGILIGF